MGNLVRAAALAAGLAACAPHPVIDSAAPSPGRAHIAFRFVDPAAGEPLRCDWRLVRERDETEVASGDGESWAARDVSPGAYRLEGTARPGGERLVREGIRAAAGERLDLELRPGFD